MAARALLVTCAASAATAANAIPMLAQARPNASEPDGRQAGPEQTQRGEQPERNCGAHSHDERGRERRLAPDNGRADQLEPAGLLLGSGVPDHQDGGEHGDERPPKGAQLDHGQGAQ